MNKLLLLFAAVITLSAKSQTTVYHPFPTGNATWVYQYYDDFHQPTWQYRSYSFNGDTLISGLTYKQVFTGITYSGALRESNKIIYFIPDTSNIEYLLYDFNMGLGDTLIHPYGGAVCVNDNAIVVQVDSVLASDGYHRQLRFNSFAYWIEGIGALNYLLNPCNVWCVSGNDFLLCMSADSSLNYPAGTTSCVLSASELNASASSISISPNPFHNFAQLSVGTEFSNAEFTAFNTLGKKIGQYNLSGLKSNLNCTGFKSGIYFYLIKNKKGQRSTGKFIVN